MFTIACDVGVGYGTLLTHLSAGVNMISRARAAALQRVTPKAPRADILGALTPEPLIVTDHRGLALVLSVTGFDDKGVVPEDPAVRQAVDQLLKRKGRLKVEDVAFTIFPQRLREMSRGDRTRLSHSIVQHSRAGRR
jgi:hypothetical protein